MLEKGSNTNPTGNLLVYCKVIGENPFQSGCEIIASNVVVSFLKINDNLPVVTFPPVSYPSIEDLQKVITKNQEFYDIARLPDFVMPSDLEDGNKYIQERMEQYNQFVMKYVDLCKNKDKKEIEPVVYDNVGAYLNALVDYSVEFKKNSGLAREVAKHKVEDLMQEISVRYPEFDIDNYKKVLYTYSGSKGDELATLYMRKFKAIHLEKYEEASFLKMQIRELEANSR